MLFFIRLCLRGQYLEIDEAEQVVLAQQLSFGYLSQPPLYYWLQYLFFQCFGVNLFALAMLKYLILYFCLLSYYRLCAKFCPNQWLTWCATLSWALIPVISFDLIKDNTHSLLALLAASLTWHWCLDKQQDRWSWVAKGALILACGFLSKYNYFIFLFALILSNALLRYQSKHLGRFIMAFCLAFILVSPYLWWLKHHAHIGLHASYKLLSASSSRWQGIEELIFGLISFNLPVLVVSATIFPLEFKKTITTEVRLLLSYHLWVTFILIFSVRFFALSSFETRWLIPIYFTFPLLIFCFIKQTDLPRKAILYMGLCLFLELIFVCTLIFRHNYGRLKEDDTLFEQLSAKINACADTYLVSDSFWILGNLYIKTKTPFAFVNTINHFSYPIGHLILLWSGPITPPWVLGLMTPENQSQLQFIQANKSRFKQGGWFEVDYPHS